jgi:protein-S-isoprenylcysteine O-methyltransferase Ste14
LTGNVEPTMHAIDTTISVGWLAFWLYWLIAARRSKAGRGLGARSVAPRLALAIVVVVLLNGGWLDRHRTTAEPVAALGLLLFVLGLAVAVWARIHLGRNWGAPMSQKTEPELVTSGPYRWVRNPIYTGIILALAGTALAVSLYWLIVTAFTGGYFVYSALVEQQFLAAQFPDRYADYRRRTKLLIPFLF